MLVIVGILGAGIHDSAKANIVLSEVQTTEVCAPGPNKVHDCLITYRHSLSS